MRKKLTIKKVLYLTERQNTIIEEIRNRLGISYAEAVRKMLDDALESKEK